MYNSLEGKKPIKRYYLMLIFVEGANCRCLHFCFLVVNALNLFLVSGSLHMDRVWGGSMVLGWDLVKEG